MNEKILESIYQKAWSQVDAQDPEDRHNQWLHKFAELIVRECIAKYDEYAGHSSDLISFALARHNAMKHFGVEE